MIVWKIVFSIFIISILSMAAYVAVSIVRIIRDAEPEIEEPKTLSACLSCRMRKWCLDSVQAHDYSDDCYEEEKNET